MRRMFLCLCVPCVGCGCLRTQKRVSHSIEPHKTQHTYNYPKKHAPEVGLDLDLAPQLVLHGGAEELALLQHLLFGLVLGSSVLVSRWVWVYGRGSRPSVHPSVQGRWWD